MDTKKLRQKILDLAIRGKLVPQDPNDEPASILLERIRAEKEQLIKEGKIKRGKKSAATDKSHYENVPFEIPESWAWCQFGEYLDVRDGTHDSPKYVDKGFPFVTSKNLNNGRIDFSTAKFISEEDHINFSQRSFVEDGDILFAMIGSIGNPVLVVKDREFSIKNVALFKPYNRENTYMDYVLYYLHYIQESLRMDAKGGMQPFIPLNYFRRDLMIPLPPLNEQKRIVSELQKLIAHIDEVDYEATGIKVDINKTKSKILDLAISGKLVPQDPNDEPAIELLKRVNPGFKPCDNSHYENLPQGWVKAGFKDIYQTISSRDYQIQQRDIINEGLYPVVSQSSNYIEGYYNNKENLLDVTAPVLIFGDHTRVVKYIDFPFVIGADGVKVIKPLVNDKFAYYLLLYTSQHIENKGYSRHFQLIAKANYCIPPLREQTHIVKTIETLFETINTITAEL